MHDSVSFKSYLPERNYGMDKDTTYFNASSEKMAHANDSEDSALSEKEERDLFARREMIEEVQLRSKRGSYAVHVI